MTEKTNSSNRRIFIREHLFKRDGHVDQIQFEFIDDFQSSSSIERNYSLWLTRDHYAQTISRQFDGLTQEMPLFEDYINTIRPLIAGHCCSEKELRHAFTIFDQNRNGIIELHEFNQLISIIGRSTSEEKISNYIERVNTSDDRTLNYEQFKQFVRLGCGRELLIDVSKET